MDRELFLRVKRDFQGFEPLYDINDKSWLISQLLWRLWEDTVKFGMVFSETRIGWRALDIQISAEADLQEELIFFSIESEYTLDYSEALDVALKNGIVLNWDRLVSPQEINLALDALEEKACSLGLIEKGIRIPCLDSAGVNFQDIPKISRRITPPVDFTGREFLKHRLEFFNPEVFWSS